MRLEGTTVCWETLSCVVLCCGAIHSTSSLRCGGSSQRNACAVWQKKDCEFPASSRGESWVNEPHTHMWYIFFIIFLAQKFIEDFSLGKRLSPLVYLILTCDFQCGQTRLWQPAALREEIFLMNAVLLRCWLEVTHLMLHWDSCCYVVFCWKGNGGNHVNGNL